MDVAYIAKVMDLEDIENVRDQLRFRGAGM
jgi:hypothetical protein